MFDREEFTSLQEGVIDGLAQTLEFPVSQALLGNSFVGDMKEALEQPFLNAYLVQETRQPHQDLALYSTPEAAYRAFWRTIRSTLAKTKPDKVHPVTQAKRIAGWLATAVLNAATIAAGDKDSHKMWLSCRDDRVRDTHVSADGQVVRWDSKFRVDGVYVQYPGEPVGPPALWINCRCLAVSAPGEMMPIAASVSEESVMLAELDEPVEDFAPEVELTDEDMSEGLNGFQPENAVPWHAVLAPEGVASGDGRQFSAEALTWRDLPLPLSWQRVNADGHDGSVVVGRIDNIVREGNLLLADGEFLSNDGSDEVVGLISEGALRGVSVDVDSAVMAADSVPGGLVEFAEGRICGATIVPIPAFHEAVINLGTRDSKPFSVVESSDEVDEFRDYTTDQRKKMADKGWALPDGSFPIADLADLKNAIHAIGRAGDPAAAKAHIKKRARALGHADLIPEGWTAEVDEFGGPRGGADKRGPGWVTHPKETRKIHSYWTTPGQPGYAKIGWGTPGDFNRCKRQLAKYIGPLYLNRTCAEWHHDALGYWPSTHAKKLKGKHSLEMLEDCGCSVNLVASAGPSILEQAWFEDPQLEAPTPLTVSDDGRVVGHLATWGVCHIGISGTCTTPPHSKTNYALFRTGVVHTNEGIVPVGQITLGTGHADLRGHRLATQMHYDNTGTAVADVACGEDEHGIWVAGAVRGNLEEDRLHALRAGALSGDWRSVGGNLELVAALVVNTPGFPIPRIGLAASAGEQTALVASGIVTLRAPSLDVRQAVREALDEIEGAKRREERVLALMSTVREARVGRVLTFAGEGGQ
jgi:hypothetical protein